MTEIKENFLEDNLDLEYVEGNDVSSSEWDEYIEKRLINQITKKFEDVATKELGISGELLLFAKPEINTKIKVNVKALIDIYTGSYDLTMAYIIAVMPNLKGENNNSSPIADFSNLSIVIECFSEKEKRLLFTLYHSFNHQFSYKIPKIEDTVIFIENQISNKEYPIYDEVDVDTLITKIENSSFIAPFDI